MIVLQVCHYSAEYSGNFIASLEALEQRLQLCGIETIYAFEEAASNRRWSKAMQNRTKVYFLPEAKARILPKTYAVFKKIYSENNIGIVHSHFELYDIPATVTASKGTKIFWHLHDPIQFGAGLRGILWKLQYGIVGKKATLLAVSDFYRKAVVKQGFPEDQSNVVLNSISLDRIHDCKNDIEKKYDFVTFGWDFYRKGDDLIFQACDRLYQEGYQFRLLLNGNETTWRELTQYLGEKRPEYLELSNPVEDVNELLQPSKVFIQASRKETFSYAVCEAAYAGMPVISSDISGLEWAHDVPSVKFFESENVDSLYDVMKTFLDGYVLDKEAILNSKEIISAKYSLDAWVNQIIGYYGI